MDNNDQHARGLKLRTEMFGREVVEKRISALGEFGKPLQHIINAYAYGDVWSRTALPPATKSLAMIAMMAAAGHSNELRVHLNGAVKNGCTPEQIQEVLLLLTHVLRYSGLQRGTPDRRRCAARGKLRQRRKLQLSPSSARRNRRMTTPRARSSAAVSIASLMSRISFDISLCQSRVTTASGASLRRWHTSSGVGAAVRAHRYRREAA